MVIINYSSAQKCPALWLMVANRDIGLNGEAQTPYCLFVCFVCMFGAYRRINPCGSAASDCIKLNMMRMDEVKKISDKIKGKMIMSLYNDN